jgi:hypothetical protein
MTAGQRSTMFGPLTGEIARTFQNAGGLLSLSFPLARGGVDLSHSNSQCPKK